MAMSYDLFNAGICKYHFSQDGIHGKMYDADSKSTTNSDTAQTTDNRAVSVLSNIEFPVPINAACEDLDTLQQVVWETGILPSTTTNEPTELVYVAGVQKTSNANILSVSSGVTEPYQSENDMLLWAIAYVAQNRVSNGETAMSATTTKIADISIMAFLPSSDDCDCLKNGCWLSFEEY